MTNDASQVNTRRIRDVVIVELPPAFTSEAEKSLSQKIEWELADTPGGVVLDFSRVTSADDGGMKALKWLFRRTDEIDLPVMIVGLGGSVRPIVESAGYLDYADEADTVEEAADEI